jgi:hypothetical protein
MNGDMTIQLLQIIGSPFASSLNSIDFSYDHIKKLFELAFENRVELLFLDALNKLNKINGLEEKYKKLRARHEMTLSVIAKAGYHLGASNIPYAVFKSIKPYPATPNDTDILCLGNKEAYKKGMDSFINAGYKEHGIAPLQVNIYDPRGKGKIGPGKKGGIYYIDFYREVAADYFVYVNKKKLIPFIREQEIEGVKVKVLAQEPELAIVMFHNVFPEKTFHLEHFYLPLYRFSDPSFNINIFSRFVEENQLKIAVRANLSLIAVLHKRAFGYVPASVSALLEKWSEEKRETKKIYKNGISVPYYFTPAIFWRVAFYKLRDVRSIRSIFNQVFHMLNPKFSVDVVRIVFRRTFGYEKYKHDW